VNPGRRDVLKAGAVAGSIAILGGCDSSAAWNFTARLFEPSGKMEFPSDPEIDPAVHVLNRIGFGPRPGDLAHVRKEGIDAYIEEQLAPGLIRDFACDLRARRFESLHASAGDIFEFKKQVVEEELLRHTVLRAVYSRRQLFENMVHFWTDHLNISIAKGECAWFKTVDDREVIRRNALGKFRDLLRASALSPAMLVYLDGRANRKAEGAVRANENYARELLELHTLGVHGGYSQEDVMEAARCLTGWRVKKKWNRGKVVFLRSLHDEGEKKVLGKKIPANGGERDLDLLLDIVARHPATSRHLAGKLCRWFVSENPPRPLVEHVAGVFRESDGDIRKTLRVLFRSPEFRDARGTRLKRPFRFVVSALRALDADTDGGPRIQRWLERMGQAPFQYPTPDGYPLEPEPWLGTLLWRWNFAIDLAANRISRTRVNLENLVGRMEGGDRFAPHLFGRLPRREEESALAQAGSSLERKAAFLMASPGFQRY